MVQGAPSGPAGLSSGQVRTVKKEIQTKQVFRSDADYLVLAGDFNVDPRDGEVRFKDNL